MKKTLALAAILSMCSLYAHAADQQNQQDEQGFYAGISVGKSNVSSRVVKESGDAIGGLNVGYQINQNFAAELMYRSMSFRLFDNLIGDQSYYPESHIGVSAIGRIPLSDSFGFYGRLGVGQTTMKSASAALGSQHETDISSGVGFDYQLTKNFSAKIEMTHFSKTGVNTTLAGIQYRF